MPESYFQKRDHLESKLIQNLAADRRRIGEGLIHQGGMKLSFGGVCCYFGLQLLIGERG